MLTRPLTHPLACLVWLGIPAITSAACGTSPSSIESPGDPLPAPSTTESRPVEPASGEPAEAGPDGTPAAGDAGGGDAGECTRAGTHRMPGKVCCPGDDGGGTVAELALCCRPPGGECDVTVPNPNAFCCFPASKCNRETGRCEARACWQRSEQCLPGLGCCDAGLVCPAGVGSFGVCCRPDGMIAQTDALGRLDCCSTTSHQINDGPIRCGPSTP